MANSVRAKIKRGKVLRGKNPLKYDPSRTATLRRAFSTEVNKRFRRLRLAVVDLIDKQDAMGLRRREVVVNCNPGQIRDERGQCGPGIGVEIPREQMPQIRKEDRGGFINWCFNEGVPCYGERRSANELSPTQAKYRQERVDNIPHEALDSEPIIISKDDYILDGTHRWVKAWQQHPERELPVLRMDLPLHDALAVMRRYPGAKFVANSLAHNAFCPTGIGGGVDDSCSPMSSQGKRTKEQEPSERVLRAKAAHVMVDKPIQRYAEEYNEPRMAKLLGGISHPDSEPMDITTKSGDLVEMKTIVKNSNDKITMDSYSQIRKIVKEQETGRTFHTIVSDDSKVFSPDGNHNEKAGRTYYYRRGVAGSARIGGMHQCKNEAELKRLMALPNKDLPDAAKRTDEKHRVGKWKPVTEGGRKGFKNSKTGETFWAKK